jgi:hypothetical protein
LFIFFLAKTANTSLAWKLTQISVADHLRSLLTDLDRQCPLRAAVQHRQAAMRQERPYAGNNCKLNKMAKAAVRGMQGAASCGGD